MKRLGLVSSSRADFGIYLPLIHALKSRSYDLKIVATGMHLSKEFGMTARFIEDGGLKIFARVKSLKSSDSPEGVGRSMGAGVDGFARLFARWRPELLFVLGDRFDMFPAALAALPYRIPVAHLYGGDVTEGAIDDALRHGMTKLSHLHFTSTARAAKRVVQMGEEPWRVTTCGALSLDQFKKPTLDPRAKTIRAFHLDPRKPVALVTFHPVTMEYDRTGEYIRNLLTALRQSRLQCVFTLANADTAGRQINAAIRNFCRGRKDRRAVVAAGQQTYFNLMNAAAVMAGNSSSGLVEAPSFKLPVVNVGTRQTGREKAANVVDCGTGVSDIRAALQKALSPRFRSSLRHLKNPYGDGRAAERIVAKLERIKSPGELARKKFYER